jgi:hypothetical protein
LKLFLLRLSKRLKLLKILRGLLKEKKEQFSFVVQAGGSKDLMKTESQEEKYYVYTFFGIAAPINKS